VSVSLLASATGAASQEAAPVAHLVQPALRVVFDTNLVVSLYIFADSRFSPLRRLIECRTWQALSNERCLGEFRRVLAYPQFSLDPERQLQALTAYQATLINVAAPAEPVIELPRCKDRDDQKFLELARDGGADWLVTADKALLKLARRDRLRGLFRILTPEVVLSELTGPTPAPAALMR
jgi:putative PIN family toxin of toxin-antitoxin system